ncbi:MAG: SGNH/GDSL hydrolase family protein [Caldimonas sp.]
MRLNAMQVRRAAIGCGVLLAALLTASCGGGTASTNFVPKRIVAFGDETSVIDDFQGNGNGRKYTVNEVATVPGVTFACRSNPLWIQVIGDNFNGLVFPPCNPGPNPVTDPTSRIRAAFGAKAVDLAAQIDAQVAESPFGDGDLVTVLVGVNDVLEQYAQYPTISEAQLTANVEAAGAEVGRQVNRLADIGAKVIISTIPDVGVSPFAIAEKAAHVDTDRQALIGRLTGSFNDSLRATMANDGRRVGLVLMDELVRAAARLVGLNGFTNATTGACDLTKSALVPPSVLDCTPLTLVLGGSSINYLWADDRHLSAGGQLTLGNLAAQRAKNNPF